MISTPTALYCFRLTACVAGLQLFLTSPAQAVERNAQATRNDAAATAGFLNRDLAPLTEPLITDRPDFTESTETVPRGHLQIEAGYTFVYDRQGDDRLRDHAAPELLLRLGLADDFELRIGWEGYSWSDLQFKERSRAGRKVTMEDWVQGANDLSLGFKVKLAEQSGWRPHFGVIAEVAIPSGSAGTSSGDVDPALKLLWAYDLTERVSLGGNLNVAVPTESGHRFVQASASFTVAVALTPSVGTYVEYFGFYPGSDGEDAIHVLNGGFTFLVTNDFQIDIRAGFGINGEADDFLAGVGFSLRL